MYPFTLYLYLHMTICDMAIHYQGWFIRIRIIKQNGKKYLFSTFIEYVPAYVNNIICGIAIHVSGM